MFLPNPVQNLYVHLLTTLVFLVVFHIYEQMKQDKKNKRCRIPNTKKLAGSMQIIILFVLHDELLCFEAHAVDLKIQLIIQVFFG